MKFLKNLLTIKFLSCFWTRNGKFFPPYFYIAILLIPLIVILFLKIGYTINFLTTPKALVALEFPISDTLILGYLGFVLGWFGVWNKWGKNGNGEINGTQKRLGSVD